MRLQHIAAVIAFASAAAAAEVRLGPEMPLSTPVLGPAAAIQNAPAAASNGQDFLVGWQDGRRISSDIFVTRVRSDGTPVEPLGRHLGNGSQPKLAWGPGGYLIAYTVLANFNVVRLQRLDDDGAPKGPAFQTGGERAFALLSNGTTYLLVASSISILDRDGMPVRFVNEPIGSSFAGAGVRGNRYVVADLIPQLRLRSIADDGSATTIEVPAISLPMPWQPAAAFGPDAILVATAAGAYAIVGYDGTVLKPPSTLPLQSREYDREVAAAWDGHQFLLSFTNGEVFRIATNGTVLDAAPLTLSIRPVKELAFARNGTDLLAVWGEGYVTDDAIRGRILRDFDALETPAEPKLISWSPDGQRDVQIARGGGGLFGVWNDLLWRSVGGALNGQPLEIDDSTDYAYVGWPTVAAGTRSFLVAWRDDGQYDLERIFAQRFDFSGKAIDAVPILLHTAAAPSYPTLFQAPPSVVFDGTAFFVAWGENKPWMTAPGKLVTVRIGESGAPFGAQSADLDPNTYPDTVRAFHTKFGFIVVAGVNGVVGSQPIYDGPATLRLARFGALEAAQQPKAVIVSTLFGTTGRARVTAAVNDDRITYAWVIQNDIQLAQSTLDGTIITGARQSVPAGIEPVPDIAWNGSEYVLVWQEGLPGFSGRQVRGLRFDANLQAIDAVPFPIAPGAVAPYTPPAVIRTATGVLIAYVRLDDTLGVARAFVRTLDRIAQPPRGRAVRR
jgi:hypothetical protein